jgi:hypothetical protein
MARTGSAALAIAAALPSWRSSGWCPMVALELRDDMARCFDSSFGMGILCLHCLICLLFGALVVREQQLARVLNFVKDLYA